MQTLTPQTSTPRPAALAVPDTTLADIGWFNVAAITDAGGTVTHTPTGVVLTLPSGRTVTVTATGDRYTVHATHDRSSTELAGVTAPVVGGIVRRAALGH